MRIRLKLTFQFASVVAILLILFSVSIYYFSANYREKQFYSRLRERAANSVKLLFQVKEIDSTLLKIIDRNTLGLVEERVVIYNERNVEIYDESVEDTTTFSPLFLSKIREEGNLEFMQGKREGIGKIVLIGGKQNVVIASAFDRFGNAKLANLRLILIIAVVTGVTLALFGGLFYSGAALRPISTVIQQVNNISATNLHLRLDEGNRKDEIAGLAITFNNMLSRLESSFEMQRSFVSNVSHELRTPLTYILGEIELMLMDDKTSEEYRNFISVLDTDIKAANNLLNNLLLLAQASMDVSTVRFETVRLDELLLTSRIEVLRNHPEYRILIDFENFPEDLERLQFSANEKLLKIAFMNLMDNGCKFSGNKEVRIVLTVQADEFVVRFNDSGIGIVPEELEKLTKEPFFRGSNAQEIPGSGIGLPLTTRILALHNSRLNIDSMLNTGSTFTVHLPG